MLKRLSSEKLIWPTMRNWSKPMRSGFFSEYFGTLGATVQKPTEFDSLNSFCTFIGHSRSGHSLMASLLDAHKNIVMADEVRSLRFAAVPCRKEQMYQLILRNSQQISGDARERAGYSFSVPEQWQGSFDKISVIGDKDGAVLAEMAHRNFPLVEKYFEMHEVPVKVLHIYRNPFDVITTVHKRHLKNHGPQPLEKAIEFVFHRQIGIESVRRSEKASCLDISFEKFVESPEENLRRIL